MEFWEDEDEDFPMVEMGTGKGNVQVASLWFCALHIIIFLIFFNVVKYQAQPCVIYTSTKSEESFLNALQSNGTLLNN